MSLCEGAYCELPQLIQQRHSGQQLDLLRRSRALSLLSGPNKSNFRGRGIDFEEVRSYQPGDDIRTIDWRVTARTGSPHTKIFREERERPVLIVTDLGNTMFFGSQRCLKSVLACHISALLGWAALGQGDRVGGLVFNDTGHREVRPKRSRTSVLSLLNILVETSSALPVEADGQTADFADMLSEVRRIARPGTSIYLISDFKGATSDAALDNLYQLSRHTELNALHCSDPLEQQLPTSGLYRVTNGIGEADLFTGKRGLRKQYQHEYKQTLLGLKNAYGKLGIPLIELTTARDPLEQLQPFFNARLATKARK
jgi:uncharacterized protein (DUF58 family)